MSPDRTAPLVINGLAKRFGTTRALDGEAVQNLSPFSHVPAIPADAVSVPPLVLLTAIAVALLTIGAVAFQRRDLAIRP